MRSTEKGLRAAFTYSAQNSQVQVLTKRKEIFTTSLLTGQAISNAEFIVLKRRIYRYLDSVVLLKQIGIKVVL